MNRNGITSRSITRMRFPLIPNATPIPLARRVNINNLAGVVYAKPDVTVNPAQCLFYPQVGTPPSISYIYDMAASELTDGVPSNHDNWPSTEKQTNLDIDLSAFGFAPGQNVGIAFNLDDSINGGDYDYCLYSSDPSAASFNPQLCLQEGDGSTFSLSWLLNDDFSLGTTSGAAGTNEGKTVVVVCPVVPTPPPSFVRFNVTFLAVLIENPNNYTPTTIDPKIKNDG